MEKLIEKARVTFRRSHDLYRDAADIIVIRFAFLSRVSFRLRFVRTRDTFTRISCASRIFQLRLL